MNITILFPVFNEKKNISKLIFQIEKIINQNTRYNFSIFFIDNNSNDGTQEEIREFCKNKKFIKAIFNKRNFGTLRSTFYGLINSDGDAVILLPADFQIPLNVIPNLISKIEDGYEACLLKRKSSKENLILQAFRKLYYKLINIFSESKILEGVTGDGIYSKKAISILKNNHDPYPLLRGLIIEKSIEFDVLLFDQELRSHGKSSYSFFDYFQYGVLSFVRHSRKFLRLIILIGFLLGIASFFTAITFLVYKLLNWNDFSVGIAPIIIGVFGLGSFQIFLIGILGEYLITLQDYQKKLPLVFEKERINFD